MVPDHHGEESAEAFEPGTLLSHSWCCTDDLKSLAKVRLHRRSGSYSYVQQPFTPFQLSKRFASGVFQNLVLWSIFPDPILMVSFALCQGESVGCAAGEFSELEISHGPKAAVLAPGPASSARSAMLFVRDNFSNFGTCSLDHLKVIYIILYAFITISQYF